MHTFYEKGSILLKKAEHAPPPNPLDILIRQTDINYCIHIQIKKWCIPYMTREIILYNHLMDADYQWLRSIQF